MYKDTKVALQEMMTTPRNPASICQARFGDASPRKRSIKVIRSKTNRSGLKKITPKVERGPCSRMIVILCANNAIADAVKSPNAKMLSRENKNE
jgi:hypothetical protein